MLALFLALIILTGCCAIGKGVLRLGRLETTLAEKIAVGTGIGLIVLAIMVLIVGLARGFVPLLFWCLFGVLAIAAGSTISKIKWLFLKLAGLLDSRSGVFLFFCGLVVTVAVLAEALTPELANDSLCYHLHLPKLFLRHKAFSVLSDELNSMYPILMEILYTLGLGLSGAALAKFFHLATGILSASIVFAWLRQLRIPSTVALSASVLFLTTPAIINQMAVTYVDVALMYFTALLLYSVWKWRLTRCDFWLGLAGVFAGACVSIKYLGILSVLLALMIILSCGSLKSLPRRLIFFCGMSFLVGGYWYFRNWIMFGNPIYPYLQSFFYPGQTSIYNRYVSLGIEKNLINFLKFPWIITMKPQWFGGFGDQLGPVYLAFLPLVLMATSIPFYGSLVFFITAYAALWFVMGQMLRFLLPILPVIAVLITVGWMQTKFGNRSRKFMNFLFFLLLASQVAIAVYHFRSKIPLAMGAESAENYLTRNERSYGIARFVNQNLPLNAKILAADETHLYYYDRTMVRDIYYAHKSAYPQMASPEKIVAQLLKDGFTHVLHYRSNSAKSSQTPKSFSVGEMIQRGDLSKYLTPIFRTDFKSAGGTENCFYVLYKINTAAS